MNLFVTVGFAVAERVMYIPSIGYSIIIALGPLMVNHYHHKIDKNDSIKIPKPNNAGIIRFYRG